MSGVTRSCHYVMSVWLLWGALSGPKSIEWRDWQTEGHSSGWGSSWERSSFGSWFSIFVFRNVPGTVQECLRICGFKRNSSNLDRAPKMPDFVLLNSWDSFLVTLSSISSETCVIFLVNSRSGRVSWLAVPRIFLLCFSGNGCQLSFVSQCCHLFERKMLRNYEELQYSVQSTDNLSDIKDLAFLILSFLLFIPFPWRET